MTSSSGVTKSEFLAHIMDERTQTVTAHLKGTAELCADFARSFDAESQGRVIGLAHDIGKCSAEFQKRLRGGRIVDHATAGAFECIKADTTATWAACCIAGHHGGLPDVGNLMNDTYGKNHLADSYIIRMLYSCLVDADYLDTERFMSDGAVERGNGEALHVLLNKLEQYVAPWWNPTNELNKRRCEVLKACMEGGEREKGLFTLTVPTGGGKTVASIAFALHHAVRHGMDRVIYVIPYTSIIEQTASVFRGIFGEGNVVEHHSNASCEVGDDSNTTQYRFIQATENWDAPIIVTTAVQFFESLYANRPSKCRKLHNIANSVVIFDEAQMLPTEQLRPCVAAIGALVTCFGASAVLCTATQPVLNDLFRQYAPNLESTELCPRVSDLFTQLRRTTFEGVGTLNADALAEKLAALPQVLCIVNSRKAAQEVYAKLPQAGSFHLSTLMYPAHRRAVLAEIRQRLKDGLPCRVVSTSLIEAGVDVDFPAVYREMAGLDSILQAAGRCNREGKRQDGIISIFRFNRLQEGIKENITRSLTESYTDISSPECIEEYYRRIYDLNDEKIREQTIAKDVSKINSIPFAEYAEKFRLIKHSTVSVAVECNDESRELISQLRYCGFADHKKLRKYCFTIYEYELKKLIEQGVVKEYGGIWCLENKDYYDPDKGISFEARDYYL